MNKEKPNANQAFEFRIQNPEISGGTVPADYLQAGINHAKSVEGDVIEECALILFVNGQEWVTLMCTPVGREHLVLGFLLAEGIISCLEDVALLEITHRGAIADVWLNRQVSLPQQRTVTSGCVGGMTFANLAASRPPVQVSRQISHRQIFDLMQQLQAAAQLYRRSQGVHTSALSDGDCLVAVAEDVGRHNTLDKIRGACMQQGLSTEGHILLTTGRISSEMLRKAADMEIPIVISRTSPTSLSLSLAQAWGITLIGYVRGRQMRIYTEPRRLGLPTTAIEGRNNGHQRGQN